MPGTEEALRQVPLFASLDDRQIKQFAREMKERRVEGGHDVVTQDKGGIAFFVILEGEATVVVDGQERATLGPGDHFGEIALFLADERRTATVTAKGDLRLGYMTAWEFRPFVEDNPKVAWSLLETLARRMAQAPAS